jgi:hypothetical protein
VWRWLVLIIGASAFAVASASVWFFLLPWIAIIFGQYGDPPKDLLPSFEAHAAIMRPWFWATVIGLALALAALSCALTVMLRRRLIRFAPR